MKRLALAAALLAAAAGQTAAQDGPAIMDRAARTYRALRSFSADFRQVIEDSMLGTFRSRGTLVQSGPSRLSMRFSEPAGEAIVLDGRFAWVYTPSTTPGQVLKFTIQGSPAYGLDLLSLLLDRPAERYRISWLREEQLGGRVMDVLSMEPTDPAVPFKQATVWLDQVDYLPRQVQVREPMRSGTRTVTFYSLRSNQRVSDRTFAFTVPPGVRVVEQR